MLRYFIYFILILTGISEFFDWLDDCEWGDYGRNNDHPFDDDDPDIFR